MKDQHSIDQLFRQKLSQRAVPPTAGDWAAMEQLLSNPPKPWWRRFGLLFSVVLVIGAASWATYHWGFAEREKFQANITPTEENVANEQKQSFTSAASIANETANGDIAIAKRDEPTPATANQPDESNVPTAAAGSATRSAENASLYRAPRSKYNVSSRSFKESAHSTSPFLTNADNKTNMVDERQASATNGQDYSAQTTSITTSTQSTAQGGTAAIAGQRTSKRVSFEENNTAGNTNAIGIVAAQDEEKQNVSPIDLLGAQWSLSNRIALDPHQVQLPVRIPSWSVRASAGAFSIQRTLEGGNAAYIKQRNEQEKVFTGFTAQLEAEKQWHRWSICSGVGLEKWQEEANYRGTIVGDSVITNSFYQYFTYVDSIFQNGQVVYITVTDSTLITLQDTVRTVMDNASLRAASGRIDWSVFSIPISLAYRMPGMPLGGTWRLDAGLRLEYAVARSGNYLAADRLKGESTSAGGFTKTSYSLSLGVEWRRNFGSSGWYFFVHPQWRYGLTSWNSSYDQRYTRVCLQGGIGFQLPARK